MNDEREQDVLPPDLDLSFIEEGTRARQTERRRRARLAASISIAIVVGWALYLTASGHWGRVFARWPVSLTMAFGGFVGGSTPQGSGAIAFPAFTKVLDVPSEVSRSFSLMIQTMGMGSAALGMIILRRRIEWRAVRIMWPVGVAVFYATLFLAGDRGQPFWPSEIPGAYVRVTFTVVLASMALVVYLGTRVPLREVQAGLPPPNLRSTAALVIGGALGGAVTALVGSGIDVLLYLVVVVLLGLDPKVGVPTSVVTMAALSALALVTIGVIDGQLAVTLSDDGAHVIEVSGEAVSGPTDASPRGAVASFGTGGEPLPAGRFDLFGMWLAAIPLVVIGGPLGGLAANRMKARTLVAFVFALAVAEVVSTAIFLEELRENIALLGYTIVALVVALVVLTLLAKHRRQVLGLPRLDPEQAISRDRLDVAHDFRPYLERSAREGPRPEGPEPNAPSPKEEQ